MGIWFIDFWCGAFYGCLLPDIDHQNSVMGSYLPFHHVIKHGSPITHSLIANGVFVALYFYLDGNYTILGVAFGMFTHLAGDQCDGYALKYLWWPLITTRTNTNVKGRRMAIVAVGPMPGRTPIKVPVNTPMKQAKRFFNVRTVLNPMMR